MELLVIGNGFDLAHGLQTKYSDFTCFLQCIKSEEGATPDYPWRSRVSKLCSEFKSTIFSEFQKAYFETPSNLHPLSKKCLEVFQDAIAKNNIWIQLLCMYDAATAKERWVDCEKMIADIIDILENQDISVNQSSVSVNLKTIMGIDDHINVPTQPDKLVQDLNQLKVLFDLYLQWILEYRIGPIQPIQWIANKHFTHILNFNYTHIYRDYYPSDTPTKQSFIHGEIRNDLDSSVNFVLGIHDALTEPLCNTKLEYAQFKKYFQRILCETGAEYQEWFSAVDERNNLQGGRPSNRKPKNTTIFGHSLDVTDKDILEDVIRQSDKTTIYYHDPEDHELESLNTYILNLIQILGKRDLLTFTNSGKIIFKPTSSMS